MDGVSKSNGNDNKLHKLRRRTVVTVVTVCVLLALIVGVASGCLSAGIY